ncbi:aminopeptidase P family protein [Streptomyces ipomoeae]|uniref:Peptidase, M24 family n=3 Tax=Streptomyces ipomoeae TaxID=103232 RepID=L1KNU5_9ACTN|nr:Xaa-Pro peptidase family protein [Streptomyces ipomoeae]EKX62058.1 peptidase, M24 family [Streptomyces ipomoeae 91-03]MDX2692663.1 Xaa-Pro peptidase family protein [Streptomyces ipomoeae]MDX2821157.1 Xaa-Pro peptidase family protein [Streptomyces ipomoeae]MDX2838733.1 Xaa-Pro peptidase family protein [Streptomyces ipomoeae]MDX2872938.1 Xaa-Pro peptidase family protein [Streptomyces ipomoeae]
MRVNHDRLQRRMNEFGLDALVSTTAENLTYLTGVSSVHLDMFPHSGRAFAVLSRDTRAGALFVCGRCEVDQFLDADEPIAGAIGYGPFYRELPEEVALDHEDALLRAVSDDPRFDDALSALVHAVKQVCPGGGRVAVDEEGVPADFLDELGKRLPGWQLVPGAGHLRHVRQVKTDRETELVAAAARVAENAIRATVAVMREGVTERELVREFNRSVASQGGTPRFTLIRIGAGAVAGQRRPTTTALRRGQAVWFDVGAVVDGYWCDIARVATLGDPDQRLARLYEAVLAGEQAALDHARPGMTGQELFELTVGAVRDAGIPHYRRNHVGHGIGVEVYDPVLIRPDSTDPLRTGTVVNIETPYYEFGFGCVHVEDPFVVGPDGNRLLTTLPRELIVVR